MEKSKAAVKYAGQSRDLTALVREESLSITTNGTVDFRPGTTGGVLLKSVKEAPKKDDVAQTQAKPVEQYALKPQKDNWDKIAAIAPIISAALIFATGGYCTYTYNQEQIRIQQCQTIEKFIPHLMGNEQTKKAAILALSTLINTETASKFASIFASTGTVSALQSLSKTGTDKDKLIATQALSSALQDLAEREDKLSDIEKAYKKVIADKSKLQAESTDTQDKSALNASVKESTVAAPQTEAPGKPLILESTSKIENDKVVPAQSPVDVRAVETPTEQPKLDNRQSQN